MNNNVNNNLLNMVKSAAAAAAASTSGTGNDATANLNNLAKMLNLNAIAMNGLDVKKNTNANNVNSSQLEQMEGTVAIAASKRPISYVSLSVFLGGEGSFSVQTMKIDAKLCKIYIFMDKYTNT